VATATIPDLAFNAGCTPPALFPTGSPKDQTNMLRCFPEGSDCCPYSTNPIMPKGDYEDLQARKKKPNAGGGSKGVGVIVRINRDLKQKIGSSGDSERTEGRFGLSGTTSLISAELCGGGEEGRAGGSADRKSGSGDTSKPTKCITKEKISHQIKKRKRSRGLG